jgi:hypothetical protein
MHDSHAVEHTTRAEEQKSGRSFNNERVNAAVQLITTSQDNSPFFSSLNFHFEVRELSF